MGIPGIEKAEGQKVAEHHQGAVEGITGYQVRILLGKIPEGLLSAAVAKAQEQQQEARKGHNTSLHHGCRCHALQSAERCQNDHDHRKGYQANPVRDTGHHFEQAAAADELRGGIVAHEDQQDHSRNQRQDLVSVIPVIEQAHKGLHIGASGNDGYLLADHAQDHQVHQHLAGHDRRPGQSAAVDLSRRTNKGTGAADTSCHHHCHQQCAHSTTAGVEVLYILIFLRIQLLLVEITHHQQGNGIQKEYNNNDSFG